MQNKTKSQNQNQKQDSNLEQGSGRQVQGNTGTSGGFDKAGKSGMKSGKQAPSTDLDQTDRVQQSSNLDSDTDLEDREEGDEIEDADIVESTPPKR